jgi:hypothetical protein
MVGLQCQEMDMFLLLQWYIKIMYGIGRYMADAVSFRPLTAEVRVCAPVGPCGICGGLSGTGTGFCHSSSGFPVNIIPPSISILIFHLGDEQ